MTQTDYEPDLSFVTLADDGYTLLLNDDPRYSARLPKNLSRKKAEEKCKIVEAEILNACNAFGLDYVTEDNIKRLSREIVDLLYQRLAENKNNNKNRKAAIAATIPPPIPVSRPLIPGKYNDDYIEFLIDCVKRNVKEENALVRQVTYTTLSSYTKDPINLGVLAPTSTGKSYPIIESVKFTPLGREVRIVGSMTPKVLIREQGVLIDKDGNPIGKEVAALKSAMATARYKKQFDKVEEIREELETLLDGSAYLLDMTNKTLIFIDAPRPELWNLLKPILSHDHWEMEHPYVDNVGHGLEVKRVITRGWPACIFCSAKDESKWDVWPEIESRFQIASPNMVKTKYQAGNKLIAQKKGLPNAIKQQLIISDEEKEQGKQCFNWLKQQIQQFTKATDSPVWIPFGVRLSEILPSDRGQDNRLTNRFYTMLNIIALSKAHLRHKLVFGDEKLVIATLHDLQEALHVMQNMSGIPPHKLKFYQQYIIPLYNSRRTKLKTKDIAEFYNANAPKGAAKLNTDNIKKTYLEELINHSYLEQEQDEETRKTQYVFTPLVDVDGDGVDGESGDQQEQELVYKSSNLSNLDRFDKNLQFSRLILPENHQGISENWLKEEILELSACRITGAKLEILDPNDNEISIEDFIKSYENNGLGPRLKDFFKGRMCVDNKKNTGITKTDSDKQVYDIKNTTKDNIEDKILSNHPKYDKVDDLSNAEELKQIAEKALKYGQTNNRDYFTESDWVFACNMWPNMHWSEDQAEQGLYALIEVGKIVEIEEPGSGKFRPKVTSEVGYIERKES